MSGEREEFVSAIPFLRGGKFRIRTTQDDVEGIANIIKLTEDSLIIEGRNVLSGDPEDRVRRDPSRRITLRLDHSAFLNIHSDEKGTHVSIQGANPEGDAADIIIFTSPAMPGVERKEHVTACSLFFSRINI
jgi:hypothetical protein